MAELPTSAEVISYIDELKNWGRWGDDDQRGTLNLIQPEHRVAAARLVTEGRTVSCARDLVTAYGNPDNCAQMYWVNTGEGVAEHKEPDVPTTALGFGNLGSAVEFFGLVFHGINVTHIDALAHLFWKGKLYNDKPSGLLTAEHGALWASVMQMSDGIVGRGVLMDVARAEGDLVLEPGRAVTPDDLEATAAKQGVTVGPGDIVLLRTGRWHKGSGASGGTTSTPTCTTTPGGGRSPDGTKRACRGCTNATSRSSVATGRRKPSCRSTSTPSTPPFTSWR